MIALLAALQAAAAPVAPPAAPVAPAPARSAAAKAAAPRAPAQPTPVPDRVAVIAALNKRTSEVKDFTMKPGQYVDFHGLRVTLRSCETTPPWEQKLTGAFVQIDERQVTRVGGAAPAKRIFSGWLFAESPSLNVLESPRYDVWVRSCTMRFPDSGPDTVSAGRAASTAKKSAAPDTAPRN